MVQLTRTWLPCVTWMPAVGGEMNALSACVKGRNANAMNIVYLLV